MDTTTRAAINGNEWFAWAGTEYLIQLRKADTSGAVGMFEGIVPPGEGPPIHVHRNEDEVIHVLEGTYKFWLDGSTTMLAASSSIFLPRGVPHTFQVIGPEPGRNLAVLTPGGFEGFFLDVAGEALTIPGDMARIGEIAEGYGLEFVGPPLAAL
ncbi:cupin domain-containing protein [Nitratireductor mangrovi]|uniref:Cupin domain-containing protein n=2 Tax=Nitratireductor mangrovi TaxID=2599600 RepID=A0A5B8L008_9HYPH|nr:cupin domain-containing protein [Nitratireductor mangrovi]